MRVPVVNVRIVLMTVRDRLMRVLMDVPKMWVEIVLVYMSMMGIIVAVQVYVRYLCMAVQMIM